MRTCPKCKNLAEEDATFCDHCGFPLKSAADASPITTSESKGIPSSDLELGSFQAGDVGMQPQFCSACGSANLPGEMFCQSCGVQLPPVASTSPPPPRGTANLNIDQLSEVADRAGSLEGPGDRISDSSSLPSMVEPVAKMNVKDGDEEVLFSLQSGEFIIGRSDPILAIYPDLDTTPLGGEQYGVSRRHARISKEGDVFYIEDLNSTNFTFLDGHRLEPGRLYPLTSGDEIQMGLLVLVFHPLDG